MPQLVHAQQAFGLQTIPQRPCVRPKGADEMSSEQRSYDNDFTGTQLPGHTLQHGSHFYSNVYTPQRPYVIANDADAINRQRQSYGQSLTGTHASGFTFQNAGDVHTQYAAAKGVGDIGHHQRFYDQTFPTTHTSVIARQHNIDLHGNVYNTRASDGARFLMGRTHNVDDRTSSFKARNKPSKFFRIGRVFMVIWTEPSLEPQSNTSSSELHQSVVRFGELVHSKIRRFIVVREGHHSCTGIPITTYGGLGVAKPVVKKSDHAIVYTGALPPEPLPTEYAKTDEEPMRSIPIRVIPDAPTDKLAAASRVNFGRTYTLEHNLKVASIGLVHPKSIAALCDQFMDVFIFSGANNALQQSFLQRPQQQALAQTSEAFHNNMMAFKLGQKLHEVESLLGQILANADNLLEDLVQAQALFRRWIRTAKIILDGTGASEQGQYRVSLPHEVVIALGKLDEFLKQISNATDSTRLGKLEKTILRNVKILCEADYSETTRMPDISRDDFLTARTLHRLKKYVQAQDNDYMTGGRSLATGWVYMENDNTEPLRASNRGDSGEEDEDNSDLD